MEEGEEAPLEDNSQPEKEGGTSDREGSSEGDSSSSPCSESKFLCRQGVHNCKPRRSLVFLPEVHRIAMITLSLEDSYLPMLRGTR